MLGLSLQNGDRERIHKQSQLTREHESASSAEPRDGLPTLAGVLAPARRDPGAADLVAAIERLDRPSIRRHLVGLVRSGGRRLLECLDVHPEVLRTAERDDSVRQDLVRALLRVTSSVEPLIVRLWDSGSREFAYDLMAHPSARSERIRARVTEALARTDSTPDDRVLRAALTISVTAPILESAIRKRLQLGGASREAVLLLLSEGLWHSDSAAAEVAAIQDEVQSSLVLGALLGLKAVHEQALTRAEREIELGEDETARSAAARLLLFAGAAGETRLRAAMLRVSDTRDPLDGLYEDVRASASPELRAWVADDAWAHGRRREAAYIIAGADWKGGDATWRRIFPVVEGILVGEDIPARLMVLQALREYRADDGLPSGIAATLLDMLDRPEVSPTEFEVIADLLVLIRADVPRIAEHVRRRLAHGLPTDQLLSLRLLTRHPRALASVCVDAMSLRDSDSPHVRAGVLAAIACCRPSVFMAQMTERVTRERYDRRDWFAALRACTVETGFLGERLLQAFGPFNAEEGSRVLSVFSERGAPCDLLIRLFAAVDVGLPDAPSTDRNNGEAYLDCLETLLQRVCVSNLALMGIEDVLVREGWMTDRAYEMLLSTTS